MPEKSRAQLQAEIDALKKAAAEAYERAVDQGSWCEAGKLEVKQLLRKVGVPLETQEVSVRMNIEVRFEGTTEEHVDFDEYQNCTKDELDAAVAKALDGVEVLPGVKMYFDDIYDVTVEAY